MLSDYTSHILAILSQHPDGLPEDQFPDDVCLSDFKDLESRGFVTIATLIPPGTESQRGMCYVRLTSSGLDTLAEEQYRRNQKADQEKQAASDAIQRRKDKRYSFYRELLIGVLIGLILLAIEHRNEVINFILISLNNVWSMLH